MIDACRARGELRDQKRGGLFQNLISRLQREHRDRHQVAATAKAIVAEWLIAPAGLLRGLIHEVVYAVRRAVTRICLNSCHEQKEQCGDAIYGVSVHVHIYCGMRCRLGPIASVRHGILINYRT
jgi:hypothetical protein